MSQRHFIQSNRTMLVTTVTDNREPFFADDSHAREAIATLYRVQERHPFFLYAFVIMPDHCHFLIYPPAPMTISKIMNVYKSGLTFNVGIQKLWQSRFHARIVRNPSAALHYIHMNPVRAGLSQNPDIYPWSSASGKWDVSPIM